MRSICISMSLNERVLDKYLKRTIGGFVIIKKTCKTVVIAESFFLYSKKWTYKRFILFCEAVVNHKEPFRIYKANMVLRSRKV